MVVVLAMAQAMLQHSSIVHGRGHASTQLAPPLCPRRDRFLTSFTALVHVPLCTACRLCLRSQQRCVRATATRLEQRLWTGYPLSLCKCRCSSSSSKMLAVMLAKATMTSQCQQYVRCPLTRSLTHPLTRSSLIHSLTYSRNGPESWQWWQ